MVSATYYRREARRCRDLADAHPQSAQAQRWLKIAADYDRLADALEAADKTPSSARAKQQQSQQQQSKQEPEDKK